MKPTTWFLLTIAGLSLITCQQAFAQGQSFCSVPVPNQVFCDDFSDGSATDGSPVTWRLVREGTMTVQDDGLVIAQSLPNFAAIEVSPRTTYTDVSMRTQVRLLSGDYIGLTARNSGGSAYAGYLADGLAAIGVGGTTLGEVPVDFNPLTQDVLIQFDLFGNELKLWTWAAGESMPTEPTVSATDDTLQNGHGNVWASRLDPEGGETRAAVRFVQFATSPIPEPSSAVLLLMGIVGLSRRSMRHRRSFKRLVGSTSSV